MTYWEYKASLDKYGTYTRGQVMDAYETAEYATIDRVLEIIDRSTEYAKELDETFSDTANGMLAASSAIHKAVLALKGVEG